MLTAVRLHPYVATIHHYPPPPTHPTTTTTLALQLPGTDFIPTAVRSSRCCEWPSNALNCSDVFATAIHLTLTPARPLGGSSPTAKTSKRVMKMMAAAVAAVEVVEMVEAMAGEAGVVGERRPLSHPRRQGKSLARRRAPRNGRSRAGTSSTSRRQECNSDGAAELTAARNRAVKPPHQRTANGLLTDF